MTGCDGAMTGCDRAMTGCDRAMTGCDGAMTCCKDPVVARRGTAVRAPASPLAFNAPINSSKSGKLIDALCLEGAPQALGHHVDPLRGGVLRVPEAEVLLLGLGLGDHGDGPLAPPSVEDRAAPIMRSPDLPGLGRVPSRSPAPSAGRSGRDSYRMPLSASISSRYSAIVLPSAAARDLIWRWMLSGTFTTRQSSARRSRARAWTSSPWSSSQPSPAIRHPGRMPSSTHCNHVANYNELHRLHPAGACRIRSQKQAAPDAKYQRRRGPDPPAPTERSYRLCTRLPETPPSQLSPAQSSPTTARCPPGGTASRSSTTSSGETRGHARGPDTGRMRRVVAAASPRPTSPGWDALRAPASPGATRARPLLRAFTLFALSAAEPPAAPPVEGVGRRRRTVKRRRETGAAAPPFEVGTVLYSAPGFTMHKWRRERRAEWIRKGFKGSGATPRRETSPASRRT